MAAVLGFEDIQNCVDVYWYGRRGNFPDNLCKPLQNYFYIPCGCHIASGDSGNDGNDDDDDDDFEDISIFPPKKSRPDDDTKTSSKLFQDVGDEDVIPRGGVLRRRQLKGAR